MELWSLLSIVAPGLYPVPRPLPRAWWPARSRRTATQAALDRFRRRIRPFLLRRTKELVAADLPAQAGAGARGRPEPRHRKIYDTHLAKERQKILGLVEDFDRNRVAIFSALTKLRQLGPRPGPGRPRRTTASARPSSTLLVDHLAEITAEGHQALVFSQFTSFLAPGPRAARRARASPRSTSTAAPATAEAVIEEFRRGEAPVFLISLKAGGVGLTLTEADYVFVLDPWWNPAAEAQAVDRAHRIGQDKHVHVYRLVATDTIEEKVMALKARKAELFAQVIDGGGASAHGISADDIRGLFEDD